MLDWFISFLIKSNEKYKSHCSLAQIAFTPERLKDSIPSTHTYDDVTDMLHRIGYVESYSSSGCLFIIPPRNYEMFYDSVANPKWDKILLSVHYEKDPNEEVKIISWPKTKYCQSDGYKAVSVIKFCRYLSGDVEKERVFVQLKHINCYL